MRKVLEIVLHTKADLEHHGKDIEALRRNLRPPSHAAAHDHRKITLVVLTTETPEALMDRLRPLLTDRFTNAWIHTAPDDIVALHGDIDPRRTRILECYRRIRDDFQSEYVGEIERGKIRRVGGVQNGPGRAPVQVHRKAPSKWRPTQNSDRPKR